jgi:small GTP-binding protein
MPKPKTISRPKPKKENVIKILLLGDSGMGKTCSMIRFFQNQFIESYITTIGVDFKKKDIILDNNPYTVYVWDTAGNVRYRTITMTYLRGSHFLILCYDTTDTAIKIYNIVILYTIDQRYKFKLPEFRSPH